jgi:hypothetical protein
LGAAFRDYEGFLVAAATWELMGFVNLTTVEACAVYQVVLLAIDCCFREVIVESDNGEVIRLLNSQSEIPKSYLGY